VTEFFGEMRNLVERMFQEILQSYISHEKRLKKELISESEIIEVNFGLFIIVINLKKRLEKFIKTNTSMESLDSAISIGKKGKISNNTLLN
jgi:flagellar hook assembly protein FlgD